MKDYYALGMVLILNLMLFYVVYLKIKNLDSSISRWVASNHNSCIDLRSRMTEIEKKIDELKTHTESKGKSTNNWENAKNAFRTLPWGVKVENE